MTYREVYKMVKRAQMAKKAEEPTYGKDYIQQATGMKLKPKWNYPYPQYHYMADLYRTGPDGSISSGNGPKKAFSPDLLNRRVQWMSYISNPYNHNTVPGKKLLQDMQNQANRKRNQYNATGRVTPSKQYRAGQRLPSGLIVTPDKVKMINQLLRQTASTNRPSSVYKPA